MPRRPVHLRRWPLTKLDYAAIIAAPDRLSVGDEVALREMGYEGASDVLARLALRA